MRPRTSVLIAAPGQAIWIHLDSVAASQGSERADAYYFVKPDDGGFLVRSFSTLKTSATLHISVAADPMARLPQLPLGDSLFRTHGRLAGRAGVV